MTRKQIQSCGVNHFLVCDCGAVLGTAYMEFNQVHCTGCAKVWTFKKLGPVGELTKDTYATDTLPPIGARHIINNPYVHIEEDA